MPIPVYDVAIIGGGINGCGIARDAAGRGLTVHLCEQGDLAGANSSATTKLMHGTLRHTKRVTVRQAREALSEQDILLAMAPHLVRPLRVVLPGKTTVTPVVAKRARHFAFDRLGGRKYVSPSRPIDLTEGQAGRPLKSDYRAGFDLPDCWIDDARLVVANAVDARARGAHIHTRTRCIAARRADSYWRLLLESTESGEQRQIAARALVNATGPWVADVLENVVRDDAGAVVRLVRGTHIVTRRLFPNAQTYALQGDDGRVVFAVPFEQDFTLIGVADSDFSGDPGAALPGDAEIDYLCAAVSRYFREPLTHEAIRFAYCGVHAISEQSGDGRLTDGAMLDLDGSESSSPLLSIIGGRMGTYRGLAEQALARLAPFVRAGDAWTARTALPGGNFAVGREGDLVRALRAAYSFLSELHAERLVNAYGTRAATILTGARRAGDLGQNFGYDLTEAEVSYLMTEEWALTAGDVLWRRSRLGLRFNPEQRDALDEWMMQARQRAPASAG